MSEHALIILAAVILDLILGDPQRMPHPARAIGRLIRILEPPVRLALPSDRVAGTVLAMIVVLFSASTAFAVIRLAGMIGPAIGAALSVWITYTCLGARDLADHAVRVHRALKTGDMKSARTATGMMVSRDTSSLDDSGLSRASIESVSENLADGAIAPLMFAALFGPVGAVAFKAVSTMDSMIGKRNERYARFGTAAARLDDLLNWIPARLSFALITCAAGLVRLDARNTWNVGIRDRHKHQSPNSAWPEAAFAGALGVKLGGSDVYDGKLVEHPQLGNGEAPKPQDLLRAIRLMWVTYALFVLLALFTAKAWGGVRFP